MKWSEGDMGDRDRGRMNGWSFGDVGEKDDGVRVRRISHTIRSE